MDKKELNFHKKQAKKFECFSESVAKNLGLTIEELRHISKNKKKN